MSAWGKGEDEATTAARNGATARVDTLGNVGSGNGTVTEGGLVIAQGGPQRRRSRGRLVSRAPVLPCSRDSHPFPRPRRVGWLELSSVACNSPELRLVRLAPDAPC
jgi:hypothetical protein